MTVDSSRKKLGKLANLDALFLGTVSQYSGFAGTTDINLNVRLIDIETGEIIYSCSAKSDYSLVMFGTKGESVEVVVKSIINDIKKRF